MNVKNRPDLENERIRQSIDPEAIVRRLQEVTEENPHTFKSLRDSYLKEGKTKMGCAMVIRRTLGRGYETVDPASIEEKLSEIMDGYLNEQRKITEKKGAISETRELVPGIVASTPQAVKKEIA